MSLLKFSFFQLVRKPRAYAEDRSSGEIGDVFTKCGIGRQRSDPPWTLCLFFCATMTCLEHQSVLIKTCIFNHALVGVLWFDRKEDYLQKSSESYVVIFGTKGWHKEMNSAPQEFKDLRKTGTQKLLWRILLVPGFQALPRREGGHKNCPSHPKVEEGAPSRVLGMEPLIPLYEKSFLSLGI